MADEKIARAKLQELKPGGGGEAGAHLVEVQFNPETLKVSYSNQVVPPEKEGAKEQRGTDGIQFIGKGTTKLSVQLWFDITAMGQPADAAAPGAPPQGGEKAKAPTDVRELTEKVVFFITPQKSEKYPDKLVLPGIRFLWGSFKFDGVVDSIEETLDFFSSDGRPLRASISMSLSQQEISSLRGKSDSDAGGTGNRMTPGQTPLAQAAAGSTIQGMAAARGQGSNWQEIAAANQIENPRLLQPGKFIDLNPQASKRGPKF